MTLYTDSEAFVERRDEMAKSAKGDLLGLLYHLLGAAALRGLNESDHEELTAVLNNHADRVSGIVEGFYVHESAKQAEANALNTLKAVIAGGVATRRDLTGEQPSEWERSFVEGTSDLVDFDGSNAYVKGLSQSAGEPG